MLSDSQAVGGSIKNLVMFERGASLWASAIFEGLRLTLER
jgi:hypothetical protein